MKVGILTALFAAAAFVRADIPSWWTGVEVGAPAAEAKAFLDTRHPIKVADALAYPITGEAFMVAPGGKKVKKVAFLRRDESGGGWHVAAVRIDYALGDPLEADGIKQLLVKKLDEPPAGRIFCRRSGSHSVIFQVERMPEGAPTPWTPVWAHIVVMVNDFLGEPLIKGIQSFWERPGEVRK